MPGEWITDANVTLARRLWEQGVGASEIARRIGGCSADAIIGKARRMHWPPHPHPPVGGRKAGLTRQEPDGEAPKAGRGRPHGAGRPGDAQREMGRVACQPMALAVPTPSFRTCQWIEASGSPWAVCGAAVAKPRCAWCADHYARVFAHPPRHANADIY